MTLDQIVNAALEEDLGPLGDITAALVDSTEVTARFVARQAGVLAGRDCVDETYAQVDDAVDVSWDAADGDTLEAGQVLATVAGPLPSILTGERTALNFLCHLSGIASLTRRYVETVAGTKVRIIDTRKTTPGLRALEKAAVRAGGGFNHRGSLSDMVLLKDNHIAGMEIEDAVAAARSMWPGRGVEVECDRLEQVRKAVAAKADVIMLDNMTPAEVEVCVKEVAGQALVEVSGRITLKTVREYAEAGPDLISAGTLTHSAPILDIGLDL